MVILLSSLILVIVFATNITVLSSDIGVPNGTPEVGQEQIIVKLKESLGSDSESTARAVVEKYAAVKSLNKEFVEDIQSAQAEGELSQLENTYTVELTDTNSLSEAYADIKKDPAIESVQWNYEYKPALVPNDTDYSVQWSLPRTQSPQGWDITTGSPSAVIAVIGTGVRWDHEDLAGNIWANTGESNDGLDNDGNGYIDDTRGWDFQQNDNNPMDQNGHETAVAGVAAAVTNNSTGITGVCWSCRIMPLRVDFTSEQVASAINYAVNKGAKIIVMSFGNYDPATYGADTVVETAINNGVAQGVLMISSAGNDNVNTPNYPSALSNVIGVAATDQDDLRATFSNWGTWVDVAAPGAGLRTTSLSSYNNVTGTSVASGFVAGVAGLLYSQSPALSVSEATSAIISTADAITPDQVIGSGRVNTLKALQASAPTPIPTFTPTPTPSPTPIPDTTPPTGSITNPRSPARVGVNLSINIKANATDSAGIQKVEFYIDGNLVSTDTSAPYQHTWSTTGLALGSTHPISAKAYDTSNNSSTFLAGAKIINDPDRDAFSTEVENYVGTNPNLACGIDAWPADFNNDAIANSSDFLSFNAHFGARVGEPAYSARHDLNANGLINGADILQFNIIFGKNCNTPLY
ncbi:MAG: S8 family serine peptidase [Patescibacteria group bacterium]